VIDENETWDIHFHSEIEYPFALELAIKRLSSHNYRLVYMPYLMYNVYMCICMTYICICLCINVSTPINISMSVLELAI
jgi:hypothetical protein